MPRFVINHALEGSRVFELQGQRPLTIGRAKSSNLVLDHESVSRVHAVVRPTPEGQWEVIDRGAVNSVKVNGIAVKEVKLRANDEVVIGEYHMRFEDAAERSVMSYGTPQLPASFARVLGESAYSGSLMPVEHVGAATSPEAGGRSSAEERLKALERENRLLMLLYRVNRALGELATIPEVTERILDFVLEIDGAERSYAMLLEPGSTEGGEAGKDAYSFQPATIRYRAGARGGKNQPTPNLAISQSIIRQVMRGGLPLLVTDAQSDPRLSASASVANAGIQSAMCAPLGIGKRMRGLLYVDNLSRRGMFTVDDLNVFAVIAVQAGLAIERVRTHTETDAGAPQPTSAK
ncbi:MAG: FHA domain-containing protein [Candidatus Acidiferrales bacterium]